MVHYKTSYTPQAAANGNVIHLFRKIADVSPRHFGKQSAKDGTKLDLNIGFQGHIYNPLDEQLASEPPCDLMCIYIYIADDFLPSCMGIIS